MLVVEAVPVAQKALCIIDIVFPKFEELSLGFVPSIVRAEADLCLRASVRPQGYIVSSRCDLALFIEVLNELSLQGVIHRTITDRKATSCQRKGHVEIVAGSAHHTPAVLDVRNGIARKLLLHSKLFDAVEYDEDEANHRAESAPARAVPVYAITDTETDWTGEPVPELDISARAGPCYAALLLQVGRCLGSDHLARNS